MILDFLNDVNWTAAGASLIAAFAIGLVWFSPSALGNFWAQQVSRYASEPSTRPRSAGSERVRASNTVRERQSATASYRAPSGFASSKWSTPCLTASVERRPA